MSIERNDYCEQKQEIIRLAERGFNCKQVLSRTGLLQKHAPELAKADADIAWIRIDAATHHYTRFFPLKRAEKLIDTVQSLKPIGDTGYAKRSEEKYLNYINSCAALTKKKKHIRIGIIVTIAFLIALIATCAWYADKTGLFYGSQALSFSANGQEYTQSGVVRYNNYVHLNIPPKKGYDTVGIIDSNTGEKVFDADGKSLSVISNKDLSDFSECNLVAVYEPHTYFATVKSNAGVTLTSFNYTIEDEFTGKIDNPQQIDGYVFNGWYTDSKYKTPFSGDFSDYLDMETPLVLYPKYSLDGWSITWDLEGGEFLASALDSYTILTDVPLPKGDVVKKEGYSLIGWSLNGKILEYFTPTVMNDITISAVWQANEYSIKVNPNNGEASYIQKVKYGEYYALNAPAFKGHTFTNFTLGGQEINSYGIYNYTSDISVLANYAVNTYNISYISDSYMIAMQEVAYGQVFSLKIPEAKPNYEFTGWYDKHVGGSRILDGIYDMDCDMVVYAAWRKILTINLESGEDYTIDKTIEKVYIVGNYNENNSLMTDICIKVSTRDNDLTINLINAGFKAKNDYSAISCENSSYTLFIKNTGISFIEGGKGSDGENGKSGAAMTESNRNGKNGNDGMHALDCGRVIFESDVTNSTLTLKAGDSGNGGNGGVQHEGGNHIWLNYLPNGGNSGNTKSALNCIAYSVNGSTLNLVKGNVGKAGSRGSRDRWCATDYGKDGTVGIQGATVSYK